jgi:hypothetical protein
MPAKPTYIGIDKIMSAFDHKAETPFFSLWVGKACAAYNGFNDMELSREKLERQINDFVDADMSDVFVIALHPNKKASYKFEDCKEAALMYCAIRKEMQQYPAMNGAGMNYEIMQKLNAMESKINALEAEEIDDEESVSGTGETEMLDKLAGILNSPIIAALLGMLAPPKDPTSHALASPDPDELTKILTVLFEKGVTVNHLKKLSEYPAEKIKMLLSMM